MKHCVGLYCVTLHGHLRSIIFMPFESHMRLSISDQ